jgi:hypothetical protein
MDMLRRLCKDDMEALDLIDQAVQRPNGGDRKSEGAPTRVDNINSDPVPNGTSEQAAIRRLRKDRPDLLEKVNGRRGESSQTGANFAPVIPVTGTAGGAYG